MGLRLELGDLPPRYRAQAEQQIASRGKKRADPMLEAARECDLLLLPYESAAGIETTRSLLRQAAPGMRIGILIGPEGGFAPEEVEQAQAAGFQVLTLGRRILRTETAGMTVAAALMLQLES